MARNFQAIPVKETLCFECHGVFLTNLRYKKGFLALFFLHEQGLYVRGILMKSIHDFPINDFIDKTAQELKNVTELSPPDWASYCRTGVHKERAPVDKDWWYTRSAAILLSVNKLGTVGVQKLRTKYGGKKNRGVKPEKFMKGSGSVARKILQQLDASGLTKKSEKAVHKGRMLTAKGKRFLNDVAASMPEVKQAPKPAYVKPAEQKPEVPRPAEPRPAEQRSEAKSAAPKSAAPAAAPLLKK